MTSSVDPTVEAAAVRARLDALGLTLMGVPQGTALPLDGHARKGPYRDFEPGSVIPSAQGRLMGAGEQSQPYIWAFQVHHFAVTREESWALSVETDLSLIGWAPSEASTPISTFYFTMYDETAKNGDRVGIITTRFYETSLGMQPDL